MTLLTQDQDLQQQICSQKYVIVQFGTELCGPCAAIRSKLEDWTTRNPAIHFLYVPLEEFSRLAAQEGIFTAPAVLIYVQGQLFLRESGCFSLEDMLSRLSRYCSILEE